VAVGYPQPARCRPVPPVRGPGQLTRVGPAPLSRIPARAGSATPVARSACRCVRTGLPHRTDSRGRVFVVGLEAEAAHPHSPATAAGAQS
jgi:hypothetical protein